MARLPQPGGDSGNWGDVLNDYLNQIHNADGTLKANSVGASALAPGAVDTSSIQDGQITETKLDSAVQTKLNNSGTIPDGSIAKAKLVTAVQTSLDKADSALQIAPVTSINTRTGAITLTKTDVGLGNVDDTADSAKPVSTAQQTALDGKASTSHTHSTFTPVMASASAPTPLTISQPNATTSSNAELLQIYSEGTKTTWMNEWGAIRTRIPANKNADSVYKGFYSTSYTGVPFQMIREGAAAIYAFGIHADGSISMAETSAPSAPSAGLQRVYPKSSGKLYVKNSAGTESTVAYTSDITQAAVGLGNVNNTADSEKPISTATQTALDGKQSRGLSAYIPTVSTGMYQPDRALYNVKPSNTRRMRVGVGRAGRSDNAAAAGNYNELWIGDSIVGGCTGLGQGAGGSDRFDRINSVAQFSGRALAAKTGISHVGTGLTRIHDGTRFDDRFTLNATATSANTGSAATVALTPGGTVTFISNKAGDQVRVTYYDNFGSGTTGFKIAINGAVSGAGYRAVTGSSTNLWKSVLLTGVTVAVGDNIVVSGNTGTVIIGFVEVAQSSGGIVTHNLSSSGSRSVSWADFAGGGGYNNLRVAHEPGMLPFEYDVVHCAFGLFDATTNPTTTAPYKTAMTTIRNYFPNADFVIHAMPVPGTYRDDPNTWLQFVTAGFELADSLDVPLVDVQGLLGGYYAEQALGLTTDTTAHLNETGYQMWGEATACLAL